MKSPTIAKTPFGFFSPDGTEYVITTPETPRPWINVISNGDYGLTISQTGGGYSWRTHAQLNRLTRWDQDLIRDEWGKYIYLRDDRGNVWSAGWKPVGTPPEQYRCRHGIGYTTIEARNFGVDTALTVFVTPEDPAEVWILRIRNMSRRKRRIDTYSYFEWGLGLAPDWHREFHKNFIETSRDTTTGALFAVKRLWEVPTDRGHWNTDWPYVGFHSVHPVPVSYDTDKESFLGMYGTPAMPAAVQRGKLMRRAGNGLDPCASLQNRMTLAPGEEKTLVFTLGCADTADQARALIARYRTPEQAAEALAAVTRRWHAQLGTTRVTTPDPSMDVMENIWLKYQAISGRIWGRTAYYQTGGAYGFRDQLQDSQVWLPIDPEGTKRQLLLHARHQFSDGTVYHWWHPISEVGLHNAISDNLLWLPYVATAYLQETGDDAILDCREPFVDDPAPLPFFDHCARAIDRALERFSDRGLPLIGAGDWNDGLSAVGLEMKGESVWLGHFLHRILLDWAPIARRHGDLPRESRYRERASRLHEALNAIAWDGEYYFGATKDSGGKLGSRENSEGSVWLNPQTWAIIGEVADKERACRVFDVVEQQLESDIGTLLLRPAYTTPDREVGYLTRYAPGVRENGGVYTHAATWAVVAAARIGRGESAYRIYSALNPVNRGKNPARYQAEPYVTAGNIEGPDSRHFGRGGWTWYTGSATWLFKVGLEWILGVRPAVEGLVIDPCIPRAWEGYRVRRLFRGATYTIDVKNPAHVEWGVARVVVDGVPACEGQPPRGKTLPVFPPGSEHHITVVMGR